MRDNLKVGEPDTTPDAPAHTAGVRQGNSPAVKDAGFSKRSATVSRRRLGGRPGSIQRFATRSRPARPICRRPDVPDLEFSVESARALPFSAVPALALKLRIVNREPQPVRSISLNVQVRIAATRRAYQSAEQDRLLELFGDAARWGDTLRSLVWSVSTVQVPPFAGETTVDLPVQCTYDFDVVSAKYFNALDDGVVPLELLFSGTVFFTAERGLQVEQIGWDKDATFRMPVTVWQEVMQRYFPNTAWLRLDKGIFDRLYRYRARHALPTWEAALDQLLEVSEPRETSWTR